jgi:crotonobetainyl-CoA:carnitine CoA-transferase CaiB-like acyl-CoA transferase
LGQHTREVLEELGFSPADAERMAREAAQKNPNESGGRKIK